MLLAVEPMWSGLSWRKWVVGKLTGLQGYSLDLPPIGYWFSDPPTCGHAPAARAWSCASHSAFPATINQNKSFLPKLLLSDIISVITIGKVTDKLGRAINCKMSASFS